MGAVTRPRSTNAFDGHHERPAVRLSLRLSTLIAYRFNRNHGQGGEAGEIRKQDFGRWNGTWGSPPEVVFSEQEMPRGLWERLAVSGRRWDSSTSATRAVHVETFATPQVF
jgi:hypothetical protein